MIVEEIVILQMNHFGSLHNGKTIFFSHMERLPKIFEEISSLNNEVILITGNSDKGIEPYVIESAPSNIKYWFAQNHLSPKKNLFSIPIGLQDSFWNIRPDHGVGYDYAVEKVEIIKKIYLEDNSLPSKFIYANFNPTTNPGYRNRMKEVCLSIPYITFEDSSLSYKEFVTGILEHEATFCPIGNGVDTHRLWEVLYCKRIPITVKVNSPLSTKVNSFLSGESNHAPVLPYEYEIYNQLYSKLPIVVLDTFEQLYDINLLQEKISEQKNKKYDSQLLDFNYWKNKILNLEETII